MGWKNITDETGNVISKVFTTLGNLRIVDNIGTQEKWTWKGVYDAICKQIL